MKKLLKKVMSVWMFAAILVSFTMSAIVNIRAEEHINKTMSYVCDNCGVEKRLFTDDDYNVIKKAIGAVNFYDREKVIFNDETEISPDWEASTLKKEEIKGMTIFHYWFNRDENDNLYLEEKAASLYRIPCKGGVGGDYWNFFDDSSSGIYYGYHEKDTINLANVSQVLFKSF